MASESDQLLIAETSEDANSIPSSQFETEQPNPAGLEAHSLEYYEFPGENPWRVQLFDVDRLLGGDLELATICPCISLGEIAHRIRYRAVHKGVAILLIIALVCLLMAILTHHVQPWFHVLELVFALYAFLLRKRVRQLFRIRGTDCDDCISAFCCTSFTIAQLTACVNSNSASEISMIA